jgi:hypothetical protein
MSRIYVLTCQTTITYDGKQVVSKANLEAFTDYRKAIDKQAELSQAHYVARSKEIDRLYDVEELTLS